MKRFAPLLLAFAAAAQAQTVTCHVTYGGETRQFAAGPTTTPLTVPTFEVGSYFLFRLVFEARSAIKTYVYADSTDKDSPPRPLHQAIFPWPPPVTGPYGFSGLHFVYEPVRDGELEYWCELR